MRAAKRLDITVEQHFQFSSAEGNKVARAKCLHCGRVRAPNASRLIDHLNQCQAYTEFQAENAKKLPVQRKLDLVEISRMTPSRNKELHRLIEDLIYSHNLPFSLVESKETKAVIQFLHPAATVPSLHELRNELLDDLYDTTKEAVEAEIRKEEYLTIIADESNNIRKERVINLSVNTASGAFTIKTVPVPDENALTAEWTANWIAGSVNELTRNAPKSLVNAVALDTCNTQLAAQNLLKGLLHNPIPVLCEAHSLQLLIKDIVEGIGGINTVYRTCSTLVYAFVNAPRRLQLFRVLQRDLYGRERAFVLPVMTRWGTQFGMVRSVIRPEQAVREFLAPACPVDAPPSVKDLQYLYGDLEFWKTVKTVYNMLKPIDDELRKAEVDSFSVSKSAIR